VDGLLGVGTFFGWTLLGFIGLAGQFFDGDNGRIYGLGIWEVLLGEGQLFFHFLYLTCCELFANLKVIPSFPFVLLDGWELFWVTG
jgi:hypothetical protein